MSTIRGHQNFIDTELIRRHKPSKVCIQNVKSGSDFVITIIANIGVMSNVKITDDLLKMFP